MASNNSSVPCETSGDCPKEIEFDTIIEDLCFHPSKDVIAAGDIDGDITIHSYSSTESNHLLMTLSHHRKACRSLKFLPSASRLVSVSKDKSIVIIDVDQGKLATKIPNAHECPLYSVVPSTDHIVASGDEDGAVKIWDLRQRPQAVMSVKENEEYVSDMMMDKRIPLLLTTSGDGTLTSYDMRKLKMKLQSEVFDAELLSLAAVKNSDKVLVGDGDGVLSIFNWNQWGNLSDRFPGHPSSIDCMVPISQDVVCTGSMDGRIRAVHILPNRFLGVVGEHKKMPVDNLSLSHCGDILASCGHDQMIRFWNISSILEMEVNDREKAKHKNKHRKVNRTLEQDDFYSDLTEPTTAEQKSDDDDDDDDCDSTSDDE